MSKKALQNLNKVNFIDQEIFFIRGRRVMLSQRLAELYGVSQSVLNQAVKRNIERFPADFMFQLTQEEAEFSRSQIVILKKNDNRGRNIKYRPYAFTQEGIAMLSGVLHSPRAIQVNIAIMRAFVKFREFLSINKELTQKLSQLESKVGKHDKEIKAIFAAIRCLTDPPFEGFGYEVNLGPDIQK